MRSRMLRVCSRMSLPSSPVTGCRPVWPETKTRLPNRVAGDRFGFGFAASGLMISFLGMAALLRGVRWWREITMRPRRVQPMAKGTLIAAMNIAPAAEAEFHEWYDNEHLPALAAVPGVLCARRFRGTGNRRYVALYHLDTPEVVESAEWKKARASDWSSRLVPQFRDHLRL